jgi:hypothetical protein
VPTLAVLSCPCLDERSSSWTSVRRARRAPSAARLAITVWALGPSAWAGLWKAAAGLYAVRALRRALAGVFQRGRFWLLARGGHCARLLLSLCDAAGRALRCRTQGIGETGHGCRLGRRPGGRTAHSTSQHCAHGYFGAASRRRPPSTDQPATPMRNFPTACVQVS